MIDTRNFTYEYSIYESGAKRNTGQVIEDKSPVNEANDWRNE